MDKSAPRLFELGGLDVLGYRVSFHTMPFHDGTRALLVMFQDPENRTPQFAIPSRYVDEWLAAQQFERPMPDYVEFVGILWPNGDTAPMVLHNSSWHEFIATIARPYRAARKRYDSDAWRYVAGTAAHH